MTNKYYQKHKGRIRKEPREIYQNLSEKEKCKRRKKAQERYQNLTKEEKEKRCNKNLSEEQKQRLVEYRRNNYLTHNNYLATF